MSEKGLLFYPKIVYISLEIQCPMEVKKIQVAQMVFYTL